jgi:hypothetical protein
MDVEKSQLRDDLRQVETGWDVERGRMSQNGLTWKRRSWM